MTVAELIELTGSCLWVIGSIEYALQVRSLRNPETTSRGRGLGLSGRRRSKYGRVRRVAVDLFGVEYLLGVGKRQVDLAVTLPGREGFTHRDFPIEA